MADFDFLDGFEEGGDWGFSSVAEKPSEKTQAAAPCSGHAKNPNASASTAAGPAPAPGGGLARLAAVLGSVAARRPDLP